MCVSHFDLQEIFPVQLSLPFVLVLFCSFCLIVAATFYSSWDECPTNLWTLPVFSNISNMAPNDLVQPVAATVTSQLKLCPYNEEEPHIWFLLIEAQFAAGGIKSQKLCLWPTACVLCLCSLLSVRSASKAQCLCFLSLQPTAYDFRLLKG
jgi:hypothetical protein